MTSTPALDAARRFGELVQGVVPGLWEDQLHDVTGVRVLLREVRAGDGALGLGVTLRRGVVKGRVDGQRSIRYPEPEFVVHPSPARRLRGTYRTGCILIG